MELSNEQIYDIERLISTYWYGTREKDKFNITETITLTIDHTEDDSLLLIISLSDITEFNINPQNTPKKLRDIDELEQLSKQIDTFITQTLGDEFTPTYLYKDPTITDPMAQYHNSINLRTLRGQKTTEEH